MQKANNFINLIRLWLTSYENVRLTLSALISESNLIYILKGSIMKYVFSLLLVFNLSPLSAQDFFYLTSVPGRGEEYDIYNFRLDIISYEILDNRLILNLDRKVDNVSYGFIIEIINFSNYQKITSWENFTDDNIVWNDMTFIPDGERTSNFIRYIVQKYNYSKSYNPITKREIFKYSNTAFTEEDNSKLHKRYLIQTSGKEIDVDSALSLSIFLEEKYVVLNEAWHSLANCLIFTEF